MTQQVLKNTLKERVKETAGNKKDIFNVRFSNGNYWIYNGYLLNTACFNLNYASIHNKVSFAKVSKDEVYTITEINSTQKSIFGI